MTSILGTSIVGVVFVVGVVSVGVVVGDGVGDGDGVVTGLETVSVGDTVSVTVGVVVGVDIGGGVEGSVSFSFCTNSVYEAATSTIITITTIAPIVRLDTILFPVVVFAVARVT